MSPLCLKVLRYITGFLMIRTFSAAVVALCLAFPTTRFAQGQLLPSIELKVGPYPVYAEIASTEAARSQGLMHRTSLPSNRGMLFVFEQANGSCFWMKNTPLPLSIAFISEQGVILNIENMRPNTTESHCPIAPMRYALEVNQGWFKEKGIGPGTRVKNLP